MKILLTGSGGFIGKNLCEYYKDRYEIVRPRSFELDLLDEKRVKNYLKEQNFDLIVHTAKADGINERIELPEHQILDSNLRMFFNLASNKELFGKMIYFGSGAEYDKKRMSAMVSEDCAGIHIPLDPYGFSKYIMSEVTEIEPKLYELCLFGVYGKYEEWSRRFISNAICRAIKGMPITIKQNVFFDYLYIDDLCRILEFFINNKPLYKRYNLCTGTRIDLYSIAQIIQNVVGNNAPIIIAQEGLQTEYTANNLRLINEIGEFSFTTMEQSVIELVKYYTENIEIIDENLL